MTYLDKIKSPDDVKNLNIDELNSLAAEIRSFLVENVTITGGHLASNLGVVELTLALLKVFEFPKDKLIFDVGHQCYVYKILTGRLKDFKTLRRFGGLSGFPKTSESEYDSFDVGHASTSVSAALGMARARDLNGGKENIVVVIGDGAITGGMSFEALNDVGFRKTRLIIVLNDNEMSIQKNTGGLSAHFTKLRLKPAYINTKTNVHGFLNKNGKVGKKLESVIRRLKSFFKYAAIKTPFFEDLGLTYIGIIDGNNTSEVTAALEMAKNAETPVLIHVKTKKGLGYKSAEENPSKYHGISSMTAKVCRQSMSYTAAFGSILCSLAEQNKNIIAITAAMADGCGLNEFADRFSNRFFDVGIAEEHAVTMAAGFAAGGCVPVFAVYSTFLQRSYDQIVHDVCLQNLHVVFAVDRAGITGQDGETHQGLLDLTFLSHIPNMTVLAPSCYDEFRQMLYYAVNECSGPVAVRYPKAQVSFRKPELDFKPQIAEKICGGCDVLAIACGRMTDTVLEAARILGENGISTGVVNIRSVKPFDRNLIEKEAIGKKLIVTIEDNLTDGGMGQYIVSNISMPDGVKTLNLGFDTCFVTHGKQSELFKLYRLDAQSVADRIAEVIN